VTGLAVTGAHLLYTMLMIDQFLYAAVLLAWTMNRIDTL
jgi:hypothetical protein